MLKPGTDKNMYEEWLASIEPPETKDAFRYIVESASSLREFTCHPQLKGKNGPIRDFRFIDSKVEQPFCFITNRQWLLFYFRLPAVSSRRYSLERLQTLFPEDQDVKVNTRGEWTVRLRTVADVQRLWPFLDLR